MKKIIIIILTLFLFTGCTTYKSKDTIPNLKKITEDADKIVSVTIIDNSYSIEGKTCYDAPVSEIVKLFKDVTKVKESKVRVTDSDITYTISMEDEKIYLNFESKYLLDNNTSYELKDFSHPNFVKNYTEVVCPE